MSCIYPRIKNLMPLNQSNLKHLCKKILQLMDIYNLAHLYTNNDNNAQ